MNKQELINEVKKMDDKDFLSQPLVLEILEQLDEPTTERCELEEFRKPRYPGDKKPKRYIGCSACGYDLGSLPCDTKYCPNCGSEIDEGNKQNDQQNKTK